MPATQKTTKKQISRAVAHYWRTRDAQRKRQRGGNREDHGARSAVTGGAQMDGFIHCFANIIRNSGISKKCIFTGKSLELPGFFRPTKKWDLLVVREGRLIAAIEAKSQAGPSFGNNFNNRTEEAMGSALDIWTAFRAGKFNASIQPFLGYFFMIEDCPASNCPVTAREPHFQIFHDFVGASYKKRYELFCRKLLLERHYSATSLIASSKEGGSQGRYSEPAGDLSAGAFIGALAAHVSAFTPA